MNGSLETRFNDAATAAGANGETVRTQLMRWYVGEAPLPVRVLTDEAPPTMTAQEKANYTARYLETIPEHMRHLYT